MKPLERYISMRNPNGLCVLHQEQIGLDGRCVTCRIANEEEEGWYLRTLGRLDVTARWEWRKP